MEKVVAVIFVLFMAIGLPIILGLRSGRKEAERQIAFIEACLEYHRVCCDPSYIPKSERERERQDSAR